MSEIIEAHMLYFSLNSNGTICAHADLDVLHDDGTVERIHDIELPTTTIKLKPEDIRDA